MPLILNDTFDTSQTGQHCCFYWLLQSKALGTENEQEMKSENTQKKKFRKIQTPKKHYLNRINRKNV